MKNSIMADIQASAPSVVHLRNYFETDFPTTATVRYELQASTSSNDNRLTFYAQAHIDFTAHVKFCSFYLPASNTFPLVDLCKEALAHARDILALRRGAQITLPKVHSAWSGAGIQFRADEYLDLQLVPLEGGIFDVREFAVAPPIYIYADEDLSDEQTQQLVDTGRRHNVVVRFRGHRYAMGRIKMVKPAAFISHDSRDKDAIARPLAVGLSRLGHSVWFDEFSLKPGDRLRESIENGIRECQRCILVLTPNFLSNKGWGTTEFNSIFSREILEEKALVVPVWSGVSKADVYAYSPSLLNVLGAHWSESNSEKCISDVARALES